MNIQFESPKTALDQDGKLIWPNDFKPTDPSDFDKIPNTPGVYIVGVKLSVDGKETFCPLYVGIRDSLRNRIKAHYKNGGYLNGQKELFDLSACIHSIYNDIAQWNILWGGLEIGKKTNTAKLNLYNKLKHLIWFNNNLFFSTKLGVNIVDVLFKDGESKHDFTTNIDLPQLQIKYPNNMKISGLGNEISQTKKIINHNFYFAYYEYPINGENYKNSKGQVEILEAATKFLLEKEFKIYTYGHTSGNGTKIYNNLKSPPHSLIGLNFDFIKLKDFLYDKLTTKKFTFRL
jgi:hypothetical protein